MDNDENILATLSSKSEIAVLLNDPEINNCTNEIDLSKYLTEHHFRATIYDMDFKINGPYSDYDNMTWKLIYKQLCPNVEKYPSISI